MYSALCFIVFLASKLSFALKDTVPVILIDYETVIKDFQIDSNPFLKTNTSYFTDVIYDSIKRSEVVIIFAEEHFSIEDVTMKDYLGTPYHYLNDTMQENKLKYLPAVVDPFQLLSQIFRPQPFYVFHLSSDTNLEIINNKHFKYFYIFFQDNTNETRVDTLRRHDLMMKEVLLAVQQVTPGPVVAFYTGKDDPVEIVKYHYAPIRMSPPRDLGVMVESEGALFRFIGVHTQTPYRRATFNQLPRVTEEKWTRDTLVTKLAYTDFELSFNFSFNKDGWILETTALLEGGEEVGRTELAAGAPWLHAYYCTEPLVLPNTRDGSAFTIHQYKIQPFQPTLCYPGETCYTRSNKQLDIHNLDNDQPIKSTNGDDSDGEPIHPSPEAGPPKVFGKTINCGPYFNTHILSGLFVAAICLSILVYGIIMLYNCTSNDRYDDPYGSPLMVVTEVH